MAKFYEPKKIASVAKRVVKAPTKAITSTATAIQKAEKQIGLPKGTIGVGTGLLTGGVTGALLAGATSLVTPTLVKGAKKATSITKAIIKDPTKIVTAPVKAVAKAAKQVVNLPSQITAKKISQTAAGIEDVTVRPIVEGAKDILRPLSINPPGTPVSRGEVPGPKKAEVPVAAPGEVPKFASITGAKRRRRATSTIATGPRGLKAPLASAGKKLFGG